MAEWIEELNATEITHNFTLEPGVWMAPVVLENKNGSAMLGRRIHFDRMLNFYVTDLFEGLAAGHYSWQCGICHRFFFMETAHKQLYCSTVNPEYGVPCAYVAKNKLNIPKQKKRTVSAMRLGKRDTILCATKSTKPIKICRPPNTI